MYIYVLVCVYIYIYGSTLSLQNNSKIRNKMFIQSNYNSSFSQESSVFYTPKGGSIV